MKKKGLYKKEKKKIAANIILHNKTLNSIPAGLEVRQEVSSIHYGAEVSVHETKKEIKYIKIG